MCFLKLPLNSRHVWGVLDLNRMLKKTIQFNIWICFWFWVQWPFERWCNFFGGLNRPKFEHLSSVLRFREEFLSVPQIWAFCTDVWEGSPIFEELRVKKSQKKSPPQLIKSENKSIKTYQQEVNWHMSMSCGPSRILHPLSDGHHSRLSSCQAKKKKTAILSFWKPELLKRTIFENLSVVRADFLTYLSHLLLVVNSSVNIVIYCWKDKKFHRYFYLNYCFYMCFWL